MGVLTVTIEQRLEEGAVLSHGRTRHQRCSHGTMVRHHGAPRHRPRDRAAATGSPSCYLASRFWFMVVIASLAITYCRRSDMKRCRDRPCCSYVAYYRYDTCRSLARAAAAGLANPVQPQFCQMGMWVFCARLVGPRTQLADHGVLRLGQLDTVFSQSVDGCAHRLDDKPVSW